MSAVLTWHNEPLPAAVGHKPLKRSGQTRFPQAGLCAFSGCVALPCACGSEQAMALARPAQARMATVFLVCLRNGHDHAIGPPPIRNGLMNLSPAASSGRRAHPWPGAGHRARAGARRPVPPARCCSSWNCCSTRGRSTARGVQPDPQGRRGGGIPEAGVCTSGERRPGVAYAANRLGVRARVFVPETAPQVSGEAAQARRGGRADGAYITTRTGWQWRRASGPGRCSARGRPAESAPGARWGSSSSSRPRTWTRCWSRWAAVGCSPGWRPPSTGTLAWSRSSPKPRPRSTRRLPTAARSRCRSAASPPTRWAPPSSARSPTRWPSAPGSSPSSSVRTRSARPAGFCGTPAAAIERHRLGLAALLTGAYKPRAPRRHHLRGQHRPDGR